jgi:hypothetical protein
MVTTGIHMEFTATGTMVSVGILAMVTFTTIMEVSSRGIII